MHRLIVRLPFLVCLIGLTASIGQDTETTSPTTILLVRHAEKAAEPADDPHLTPAGEARARALAHVAGQAGVSAIFVTDFHRTRETAAVLEAALEVKAEAPPGGPAELAELILTEHRGKTVLVVGHSNTVPSIISRLGGPRIPLISEDTYDNFFVTTVQAGGEAHLLKLKYGAPPQ